MDYKRDVWIYIYDEKEYIVEVVPEFEKITPMQSRKMGSFLIDLLSNVDVLKKELENLIEKIEKSQKDDFFIEIFDVFYKLEKKIKILSFFDFANENEHCYKEYEKKLKMKIEENRKILEMIFPEDINDDKKMEILFVIASNHKEEIPIEIYEWYKHDNGYSEFEQYVKDNYYDEYSFEYEKAKKKLEQQKEEMREQYEFYKATYNDLIEKETNLSRKEKSIEFIQEILFDILRKKEYVDMLYGFFNTKFETWINEFGMDLVGLTNNEKMKLAQLISYDTGIKLPESYISYGILKNNEIRLIDNYTVEMSMAMQKNNENGFKAYKEIVKENYIQFQRYYINDIHDFLNVSLYNILMRKPKINKCQNCNKYFFPKSKSNEKYCSNVFRNGKTCSQLSYEIKLNKSELDKIYRATTTKATTYKSRYKEQYKDTIEEAHDNWKRGIKEQRELCRNGQITLDEFKKWIKENDFWWKKGRSINGNTRSGKK